jgi:hypothetical protein
MFNARFLYDLTVPRCGRELPRRRGGAGGGPGCQALKRVHPDNRLRLPVINEPLLCRPILLPVFLQAQNPSSVPLPRQEIGMQLGGLDGAKGPAGAQGIRLGGRAMNDIIHSASAVSQRRVTGQEAMRGYTVRHK